MAVRKREDESGTMMEDLIYHSCEALMSFFLLSTFIFTASKVTKLESVFMLNDFHVLFLNR